MLCHISHSTGNISLCYNELHSLFRACFPVYFRTPPMPWSLRGFHRSFGDVETQ